ncbi:hypothetical protein PPERSA_10915 [Pseudocohnilembus persalinus]|uniref:Transmembrane protein n=1 Tax=Pseudocohnilembus persalinus TaxID=266149 RepID=A0A0V0R9G2_PSEPJ|nr:hypothetical protein PPERSA_10915 [Pseudocohnilembus persalinus]|eukprot:KRX11148.1 hypothetical protein PPERSA_10915 [Pseudocohnilembus persalinus]
MELITQQALNNIFQQKRTLQGQKINNYDFIDNNEVSDSDEDDENEVEDGVMQNNNQYQSNQTYVQQNYQSEFQQQSSNQLDGFDNNQQQQQIGIQQINLELIQEQNQKRKSDIKVKFNLKQQQLENMESCEVKVQPYQFEPPLIQIINPYQSSSQMDEYQQMTEEQLFHNNNNNNNSNSNKNSLNHNKQSQSSQQSSYQVYNNHLQKRKLWQEWPGKNMICCGGFLLTGPRKYMFIMFALCVLIISSDWPDNRDIWKIVLSLVLLVYFILILGFLGICILLRCRTNQTFIEWWKQQRQVNMNYDENIQEYTDNFDKCISKKGLFDLRQIIYV